jgi:hypothetical protein
VDLLDLPEAAAAPPERRLPALSARLPQHMRVRAWTCLIRTYKFAQKSKLTKFYLVPN